MSTVEWEIQERKPHGEPIYIVTIPQKKCTYGPIFEVQRQLINDDSNICWEMLTMILVPKYSIFESVRERYCSNLLFDINSNHNVPISCISNMKFNTKLYPIKMET